LNPPPESPSARLDAWGCRTALGDAAGTLEALLLGRTALRLLPVLGPDGGDAVPLAPLPGRERPETAPPGWLGCVESLAAEIPPGPWGSASHPVFVASSNFGVGSLHAYMRTRDPGHLAYATPFAVVDHLSARLGWGANVAVVSHACVSAHVGLLLAGRTLQGGGADRALVFAFDFLSPFVAGGFHALKILNGDLPAPYAVRPTGAIGLGDGTAFAVLGRGGGGPALSAQTLHNEMHHFTGNRDDGGGFSACLGTVAAAAGGRRLWVKGHGTGTLDAGRQEAEACARLFPGAPLVSWKGALGHTLGSCGLVELALACEALRRGRTPGTVGSAPPCFASTVATEPFDNAAFDGVVLAANAFGGAHAACLLSRD
jgi:3-oxoacyl-[acyl-carrier-protein] synthase I